MQADAGTDAGRPIDLMGYDIRVDDPEAYTRVDRLGMPLISILLVTNTDDYNDENPEDDARLARATEQIGNLANLHMQIDDELMAEGFTPCNMIPAIVGDLPPCVSQVVIDSPRTRSANTSSPRPGSDAAAMGTSPSRFS